MAWPTDDLTNQHTDEGTDNPSLARSVLNSLITKVKTIIGARGQASGICDLDSGAKVPVGRLPGGAGSGINADLVQGVPGDVLARTDIKEYFAELSLLPITTAENGGRQEIQGASGYPHVYVDNYAGAYKVWRSGLELLNAGSWGLNIHGFTAWHAGNDGPSSGLDADTLQGLGPNDLASVSVLSGVIADGGTIPLPAGYAEAECNWLVSMAEVSPLPLQSWSGEANCFTTGRVVTAQWYETSGSTWEAGNANYLIIGVK